MCGEAPRQRSVRLHGRVRPVQAQVHGVGGECARVCVCVRACVVAVVATECTARQLIMKRREMCTHVCERVCVRVCGCERVCVRVFV